MATVAAPKAYCSLRKPPQQRQTRLDFPRFHALRWRFRYSTLQAPFGTPYATMTANFTVLKITTAAATPTPTSPKTTHPHSGIHYPLLYTIQVPETADGLWT